MSKRTARAGGLAVLACAVTAAFPGPVEAADPIVGKLSERGYDLLGVAPNGKTRSARIKGRRFKLRPRAETVSLHLRARDGTYAGPVVVAKRKRGKRAIVGVRAGARIRKIAIVPRRGIGRAKRVRRRSRDSALWAKARRGTPIGNGRNFGRVRSRPRRGAVPGDLDRDGVPNALDIDDDGDRILDPVDRRLRRRSREARANLQRGAGPAARGGAADGTGFHLAIVLPPPLTETINVNAGPISDADVDEALSNWGYLILGNLSLDAELDCGGEPDPGDPTGWIGGLAYCSRGGTGSRFDMPSVEFPECCDTNENGFGTMINNAPEFPPPSFFFLKHGATSSQIGTGDVLIQRDGAREVTELLPFVFATTPALVSYDDGAGNSVEMVYPVPPGGPGTMENPLPVEAQPGGDVILTLTFWRPQRRAIRPEAGDWIDVGGLYYTAKTHFTAAPECPQDAYSDSDPNLIPSDRTFPIGLVDVAGDAPASPANTFTFTLNLTECREAHGESFDPGETVTVPFSSVALAAGSEDGTRGNADFAVSFQRAP